MKTRVTPEDIDNMIAGISYTVLPSGKVVVCELTLWNGFTVRGEAAVVCIENFDMEIGRDVSYRKAKDKLWEIVGYLLQEKLYRESQPSWYQQD